jgi:hypothetical protein
MSKSEHKIRARRIATIATFVATAHDRQTGATERVSVGTGGVQSNDFASSVDLSISGDGRYVAFRSAASNWMAESDQVNDVFVHDRLTGTTNHVCFVSASRDSRGGGVESDAAVWSIFGAQRSQPVATAGRCVEPENGTEEGVR